MSFLFAKRAELLLRVGAARDAAELLRAHTSPVATQSMHSFWPSTVGDGQIGPARDAFAEALKTNPSSNVIGLRDNFAF
jgi:hypothetical protein